MALLWKRAATLCKSTRQVVSRCFWNIKLIIHGNVSNKNFFDCFAQMLFSRYQQRGLSPFFIEIHVDLLHYIPCDAHWKGQISNFMQIWCALKLRTVFAISLDDIRLSSYKFFYSCHLLWVSIWASFTISIQNESANSLRHSCQQCTLYSCCLPIHPL